MLDRDLSLRFQCALTGGTEELFLVMQDSTQDVVRAALKNPFLKETHLLSLLCRQDLQSDLLKAICNSNIARESHPVRLALAHHKAISPQQLSEMIPHLHLFELVSICSRPGGSTDQKVAVERAIIKRLPSIPLGNKITLAHRATEMVVEALLREGDSRIMAACLDNTRLKEGAVFKFLRSSAANAETISMIARHSRWQNRPNLKAGILSNPKTPLVWFTNWLPSHNTTEVRKLYESQRLSQLQRREVLAELQRRGERP